MPNYRKLKSGKYQARAYNHEGVLVSLGTFNTKTEAKIVANKFEQRKYYGQSLLDRNITFQEVADKWLYSYKKQELKERVFLRKVGLVEMHILPYFGKYKIMNIKRQDVKEWLNSYSKDLLKKNGQPYSTATINKHLSDLKSIFHFAIYELEVIEKSPADRLKVVAQDRVDDQQTRKLKYYSSSELDQLLDFMSEYRHQRFKEYQYYYALMYFLSETGLRIGEALAIRWTDFKNDMLLIEKQVQRDNNNKIEITSLKSTASYREIKLTPQLVSFLKRFKAIQNEMILRYEQFNRSPDGIVFQNFKGDYLTPSIIRDGLRKYCKLAGVDYKGNHGFRHTHAVLLLESGASLMFVKNRLGHKSLKTTTDTYLATTQKIEQDELNKFSSYRKKRI